jgi:hypothetical protein
MPEISRQRVQEAYTPAPSVTNPNRASDFVILNTNLATLNRGTATNGVFAEAIWDSDLTDGAANHSNMIAVDVPTDAKFFVPFWVCTATVTSGDAAGPCAITGVTTTASTGAGKLQVYGSMPVGQSFNKALPNSIVTGAAPNYAASLTVPVMGTYLAAGTIIATYSTSASSAVNQVAMYNQYLDGTDAGVATTIIPVNMSTTTVSSWNTSGAAGAGSISSVSPGIPLNGITRMTCAVLDAFAWTFTAADANGTSATVSNARVMLGGFFAG